MLAVINGCDQVTTQVTGAVMILGLPEMFYVSRAQKPEKVGNGLACRTPLRINIGLSALMNYQTWSKILKTLCFFRRYCPLSDYSQW